MSLQVHSTPYIPMVQSEPMNIFCTPISPRSQAPILKIDHLCVLLSIHLIAPFNIHLQTYPILDTQCISKLAQSQSESRYLYFLDLGTSVHMILTFKCVPKSVQSWTPTAFVTSLDYTLQVFLSSHLIKPFQWISYCIQLPSPLILPIELKCYV